MATQLQSYPASLIAGRAYARIAPIIGAWWEHCTRHARQASNYEIWKGQTLIMNEKSKGLRSQHILPLSDIFQV